MKLKSKVVTALLAGAMIVTPTYASQKCVTKKHKKSTHCGQEKYSVEKHSHFIIGPYLPQNSKYSGSELLINYPGIREDARLLQYVANLEKQCKKLGITLPNYPRITVSGTLAGQYQFTDSYLGKEQSALSLSSSELDSFIQVSPWITGFAAVDYDPNIGKFGKVLMTNAFVTVGNFSRSPFYGTIGKIYVPFGRFSSNMISAPFPLVLAKTTANSIVVGYQQQAKNHLHAEAYAFQGDHAGADVGYDFSHGKWNGSSGASYISTITEANGIKSVIGNSAAQAESIPAVDVYGSLGYGQVSMLGEYVTTIKEFNAGILSFKNQGARPSAENVELAYSFKLFGKPSSVAVGYGRSSQALALGLPKQRYDATFTMSPLKDTSWLVEFSHSVNYSKNAASSNTAKAIANSLGKSDDAITTDFSVYF